MNKISLPADRLAAGKPLVIANAPDAFAGLVAADLARNFAARAKAGAKRILVICRDAERMAAFERALDFFAPDLSVLTFPAWDCLPYDRVSPNAAVSARRMATLAVLAQTESDPGIVLTTVNAFLQRVPARAAVGALSVVMKAGNVQAMDDIVRWLEVNGFSRTSTVRDVGEYAVRGGILDLYVPGMKTPVRLDFFGDTLESIKSFDPETQRSAVDRRNGAPFPVELHDRIRRADQGRCAL